MAHKAGFVNIIGNPNVGKSTLMNALVGEKLSIVTAKAQTTRHRIMGIVNGEDYQIVYSDTPGILKPNYRLQQSMLDFVDTAIGDADIILYVTDTVEKGDKNEAYIEKLAKVECPVVLVINKIDISSQEKVVELMQWWHEKLPKAQAALGGGGDLVTKETFRDFELSIDFRLTAAANSGIKYFYNKDKFRGTCEEYQLLDPAHPDATRGRDGNRRVAALYDVMPSTADKVVKPAGEWNTARIVSKGSHVEHWLNGVKVLEYERGSELFREKVKRSKFKSFEKKDSGHWGEAPEGHIKLQDHTDSTVSFRNIKIRRL